ncbi:MAG: metallophosphoesterase [Aquihabitans sp.]
MGVTTMLTAMAIVTGLLCAAVAVGSGWRVATSSATVLVRTALAGAVLSVLGGLVVLLVGPADLFAAAHYWYLVIVVGVPIAAVGLVAAAARGWPSRRWLGLGAVVLLVVPPTLGFWSTHVAPYQLREDRVDLALRSGRTLDRPLRIGVLSDLQNVGITGYEQGAVDRLMRQRPDLILIAGDLFQGGQAQLEATLPAYRQLLGRLDAPGGVFVVRGDVDGGGFDPIVEGTGVTVLDDEVTTTEVDGQRVVIGGVRLQFDATAAQPVYEQLEATAGADPVILLAHRPDAVSMLASDSRVDLTIAGHTHGGQIALPFFGPLTTMSSLPRSVGAGGLHEVEGNAIYVSTGIGMERNHAPQVRFLTRPSYGIIEVTAPAA